MRETLTPIVPFCMTTSPLFPLCSYWRGGQQVERTAAGRTQAVSAVDKTLHCAAEGEFLARQATRTRTELREEICCFVDQDFQVPRKDNVISKFCKGLLRDQDGPRVSIARLNQCQTARDH